MAVRGGAAREKCGETDGLQPAFVLKFDGMPCRWATITDAVRRMAPWCCESASEARATRPEAAVGFRKSSAIVGTSASGGVQLEYAASLT